MMSSSAKSVGFLWVIFHLAHFLIERSLMICFLQPFVDGIYIFQWILPFNLLMIRMVFLNKSFSSTFYWWYPQESLTHWCFNITSSSLFYWPFDDTLIPQQVFYYHPFDDCPLIINLIIIFLVMVIILLVAGFFWELVFPIILLMTFEVVI